MADSPGSFRARILTWGPVPPSGGPFRLRYLEANGREALRVSDAEYAAAMSILGDHRQFMPVLHTPHIELDEDVRRQIQRRKRSEWIEFASTIPESVLTEVEPHIRLAESSAVDALNHLEDHELAETSHTAIHRAAFVRRGLFGCPIVLRDDNSFWTACSVNMSHLRLGLSAGIVSDWECSICGRLVEDCDHIMARRTKRSPTRMTRGSARFARKTSASTMSGASTSCGPLRTPGTQSCMKVPWSLVLGTRWRASRRERLTSGLSVRTRSSDEPQSTVT